jgi:regulator of protease activity HflC (stomatin/prohibitin superfamily)
MLDLIIIVLGVLLVVAMMVFVINPPEAWIKRVFHRDGRNSGKKSIR